MRSKGHPVEPSLVTKQPTFVFMGFRDPWELVSASKDPSLRPEQKPSLVNAGVTSAATRRRRFDATRPGTAASRLSETRLTGPPASTCVYSEALPAISTNSPLIFCRRSYLSSCRMQPLSPADLPSSPVQIAPGLCPALLQVVDTRLRNSKYILQK